MTTVRRIGIPTPGRHQSTGDRPGSFVAGRRGELIRQVRRARRQGSGVGRKTRNTYQRCTKTESSGPWHSKTGPALVRFAPALRAATTKPPRGKDHADIDRARRKSRAATAHTHTPASWPRLALSKHPASQAHLPPSSIRRPGAPVRHGLVGLAQASSRLGAALLALPEQCEQGTPPPRAPFVPAPLIALPLGWCHTDPFSGPVALGTADPGLQWARLLSPLNLREIRCFGSDAKLTA